MQKQNLKNISDRDHLQFDDLRRRFTDRQQYLEIFENSLKLTPPPVLMFYGIGGVGKTWLLRYLLSEYCSPKKQSASSRAYAFLSFRSGHTNMSVERALYQAKIMLKATGKNLMFPKFDLFWGLLWEKSNKKPIYENEELQHLPDELSWFTEILQSVLIPPIGDAVKTINIVKKLSQRVQKAITDRHVVEWYWERIGKTKKSGGRKDLQSLDIQELTMWLPIAFASDLADNTAKLSPSDNQIVIFIDNYEGLEEKLGRASGYDDPCFIESLALELLECKANVLLVIAGRDRLRWAETQLRNGSWVLIKVKDILWIENVTCNNVNSYESRYLIQKLMGDLSVEDARDFLLKNVDGLSQPVLNDVIQYTGGYPLALGVVVDLLTESSGSLSLDFISLKRKLDAVDAEPFSDEWKDEVNRWLLQRLKEQLKQNNRDSLMELTHLAAVPRWFNQDLLLSLTPNLGELEQFQRMIGYSFVEPYEIEGVFGYRLHALIRKLLREEITGLKRQEISRKSADWFVEKINESTGKGKWRYRFEYLYHLWQFDTEKAVIFLEQWFQELQKSEEHDLCWELLETALEVEKNLPVKIQTQFCLYRSTLFSKAWQNKGENRALALEWAEKALQYAEKCDDLDLTLKSCDAVAIASLSNAMGISSDSRQHLLRAICVLKRECEEARLNNKGSGLARALLFLARMETELNPDYGNFSLVNTAIRLYRENSEIQGLRDAYFDKAVLAMRNRRWELVSSSLKKAEENNLLIPDPDPLWQAHAFQVWGEYHAQCCRWNKADSALGQARKIYKEHEFMSGICASTGWHGIVQCYLGNTEEGLSLILQSLGIEHDILGSQEGVAKWLHFVGEFFIHNREYERALSALWLSESIRESIGHSELSKTKEKIHWVKNQMGEDRYFQIKSRFRPRNSEFGKYAFLWGFDNFEKSAENPILIPQGETWERQSVFNPTSWTDGKKIYLLYRAVGSKEKSDRTLSSSIGLAVSEDGIHFNREIKPVVEPSLPYEIPGGCEDPRLVRIEDTFYLTYTAYDGKLARLCIASSTDLHTWSKLGLLFPDKNWDIYFPDGKYDQPFPKGWSKSGAILDHKVNGYYWMYFGDTHIWAAYSLDLLKWDILTDPVLSPRQGCFDSKLVEPGPTPITLPEGIWLGYNAADSNLHYSFGQALFSSDDPGKLIQRCVQPILRPTTDLEFQGNVPNVVFGEGLTRFQDKWFLYYGMADSRIGVAISNDRIRIDDKTPLKPCSFD